MSIEDDTPTGDAATPTPDASSSDNDTRPAQGRASTGSSPSISDDSPVGGLLAVGGLLVLAGIVAGFIIAFQVSPDGCDANFESCAHPHVALGVILIGASLFAGVILALIGVVAWRVVRTLPRIRG